MSLKRELGPNSTSQHELSNNSDLNVTEDDLLQAREHAKDLSLEETREVLTANPPISGEANETFVDNDQSCQDSRERPKFSSSDHSQNQRVPVQSRHP